MHLRLRRSISYLCGQPHRRQQLCTSRGQHRYRDQLAAKPLPQRFRATSVIPPPIARALSIMWSTSATTAALVFLFSGMMSISAQSPGAATDCYAGNSTACIYSLGECQSNADCANSLPSALAGYGISSVPSDAEYECAYNKCDLLTPSTTCAANINLPVCDAGSPAVGPAQAPIYGPVLAPSLGPMYFIAPVPAFSPAPGPPATFGPGPSVPSPSPGDCSIGNSTVCAYSLGQCQADSDCPVVVSDFFTSQGVDSLPSDAEGGCDKGKCALVTPSTACFTSINLPECIDAFAPVPAPVGPVPAPPSTVVLPARCSTKYLGSTFGCCIEFTGSCTINQDCESSISGFFATAPVNIPADYVFDCYRGQCFYASETTACSKLGETLPTCTDGNTCVYSAGNFSSPPPPAANIHVIPAAARVPPAPPPPSGGARSAAASFLCLGLVIAALWSFVV